tara:strand:- start:77 stop:1126 length:1050 start_codon:yes stop_codon:yes gene_type:complete
MSEQKNSLDYAQAGVNIDAGNELIKRIAPFAKATKRPEVMAGLGGFGALFELPIEKYKKPVLVSGTDGVGTKLKLAFEMNKHDTIGIDLVAMCVNDLVVVGAEPLFFLDYYATGKLSLDNATDVIKGIAEGCKQSGCSLVGGETAEMPGMYSEDEYDLAGFCVGIVEKDQMITGENVQAGDTLIAISSSGVHSNGFSLVRKILEVNNLKLTDNYLGKTIGETLLEPTKLYVKPIQTLLQHHQIKAISHITGGGITENVPRVLPENTIADIDLNSWELPAVFQWLQDLGNITQAEMLKTFNCGVGMVLCVASEEKDAILLNLHAQGEIAWEIGSIKANDHNEACVNYSKI